jgi:hypothetical protein
MGLKISLRDVSVGLSAWLGLGDEKHLSPLPICNEAAH